MKQFFPILPVMLSAATAIAQEQTPPLEEVIVTSSNDGVVAVWLLFKSPGVSLLSTAHVNALPVPPVPTRARDDPGAVPPDSETPTFIDTIPAAGPS